MHVTCLPALRDNYIWALRAGEQSTDVCVVDPGDAAPVEAALDEHGWTLTSILLTHHHHDHTGGVEQLLTRGAVPVFGPASDRIVTVTDALADGDVISPPGIDQSLTVMTVPGHTLDHICFVSDHAVFCGDALFSGGCGRLFEGTPDDLLATMRRFRHLPDPTAVYSAHEYTQSNLAFAAAVEPDNSAIDDYVEYARRLRQMGLPTLPSTMALEKKVNPFLRFDHAPVQRAASSQSGNALERDVDVLAALRAWKDGF